MSQRGRFTIRIVVWGAAFVFLLALALRDFQLDRTLEVTADTLRNRATPYVSAFGPPSRVDASSGDVFVIGEPAYVNLRIPRWFRRATIELRYENPANIPLKFGVRTHPTLWAFQFPEPEPLPLTLPLPGGGEKEGESPPIPPGEEARGGGDVTSVQVLRVPFDLQRAWQVERNVYRFVLSVPGASPEQPIVIRGLHVTAERDSICLGRLCV